MRPSREELRKIEQKRDDMLDSIAQYPGLLRAVAAMISNERVNVAHQSVCMKALVISIRREQFFEARTDVFYALVRCPGSEVSVEVPIYPGVIS
jgi:hypothetical protein